MNHLKFSTGVAATAVISLTLAGCGGGSSSTSSTGSSGGATGGSLVVDNSFILKTIDPGREFETTGGMIDHALYSTLLTFTGGDLKKPVPDLASAYTASPDGKTYTFTLRKDAVFSDGTPVTSADVLFSFNRQINIKGNASFLLAGVTVTAPDAQTVVLTSKTPNAAIPYIVPNPALGILNSKAVMAEGGSAAVGADKTDTAETALNTKSQGSGPYVLTSYSNTTQVVLAANPKYWGTKPHYSKIVIRNVAANVQKLNVLKGESQLALDLSPAQAKGLSGVQTINGASPNVIFLFTNRSAAVSPAASNPDFQQAVRYGIDYDGLIQLAGTGAVQATGVIPSMFLGSLPAGSGVKRDVAKAKAALAKSGLTNPTVKLAYPSDLQVNGLNFGDLAARIQQNLKEVGITVQLAPAPVQTALDGYRNGKEELGLWYWGPDFPDPSDYLPFLPGGLVGLRANWKIGDDATLDKLGIQASSTVKDDTRAALYQQIQTTMNASGPFMPVIQPAQILVAGSGVKNAQANAVWSVGLGELG